MKKLILSLAVVFVISSFTAADTEKMNIEPITLEEVDSYKDHNSTISLVEDTKAPEVVIDVCVKIGAMVLAEASKGGYSLHQALTLSFDAMIACEALILIGLLIT